MSEYRGFYIIPEYGHYRVVSVISPWATWTEDTIEDAKRSIDKEWEDAD